MRTSGAAHRVCVLWLGLTLVGCATPTPSSDPRPNSENRVVADIEIIPAPDGGVNEQELAVLGRLVLDEGGQPIRCDSTLTADPRCPEGSTCWGENSHMKGNLCRRGKDLFTHRASDAGGW
jgi:hypothetical protein